MQDELMKLLEEIDKAPPGNRLSQGQLKTISRKWYAPDITENFTKILTEQLIKEAYQIDLIRNTTDPTRQHGLNDVNDNTQFFLTIKGFEYLNQIWIKKAIVKFNESSDEYSNVLIGLTVFIALLTIILISPEDSTNKKNFFLVFAYIVLIFVLYHKKLLRIFKK